MGWINFCAQILELNYYLFIIFFGTVFCGVKGLL